jgi:hypothetical protein
VTAGCIEKIRNRQDFLFSSCLYELPRLSFFINFYQQKSLPNGGVLATYDKWLTMDELAGSITMSRTKLYGMARR